MIELSKVVAKLRLHYHANLIDICNCLNQIGLVSDDKNEEFNRKHVMICVNDIAQRLK